MSSGWTRSRTPRQRCSSSSAPRPSRPSSQSTIGTPLPSLCCAAERAAQAAHTLWVEVGDATEEGFALFLLGFVARTRGDFPAARALLEHGVQVSRRAGDGAAEANCLWSLADPAYDRGEDREARVWGQAALGRATEVGWPIGVAVARRVLGAVHLPQGEYAAAEQLGASLAEARAMGARWWIAETAATLSCTAALIPARTCTGASEPRNLAVGGGYFGRQYETCCGKSREWEKAREVRLPPQ